MATATVTAQTNTTSDTGKGKGILSRFFNGVIRLAERNARYRQAECLQAMSDAELAARGLKREDIVRHVYRDRFYL
ncbi:DUF1127 domain-containing protein [Roseivivax sp. CAU 1753]